jgi:SAM-dependent methyltransferase
VSDQRSASWDEAADTYGADLPFFGDIAAHLVAEAAIEAGERVLDIGTGNGLALVPAARAASPARATGIDFSAAMLRAARTRTRNANVDATLAQMDAARLAVADSTFDVLTANSVFQFLGYATDTLREWRRVLRASGRLVFSLPRPDTGAGDFQQLMLRYFGRLPKERRDWFVAQGPPPPIPDLVEACLAAGFSSAHTHDVEWPTSVESREEWWRLQWTHGARVFLRELPPDAVAELERDTMTMLEPLCDSDGVVHGTIVLAICIANR